jgi:glycogen debranching enzyme
VRRALEWIERYGDRDGDGFVEYRSDGHGTGQLAHQNWKDSFDSLNHVDGRPATGLIAAVEVQGYVFACYNRLADAAAAYGENDWAIELRGKADAIRRRVEEAFWLEPEGFYAQALDGEKEPVRTISSNPGHLLACGLPSPERAARVATRLRHPDMDSGWGIRTLTSAARTYNPMSYHNGSVWPHDNSFIASGLYRYGHTAFAHAITEALFAASESDPLRRLPELYCGFARTAETADAPVAYPVSCNPQAWAAGALPFLVRSMLGLHADIECRCLVVAPALPDWLNLVVIDDLQFQGRRGRLTVRRDRDDYAVRAEGLPVEIRPSPPAIG